MFLNFVWPAPAVVPVIAPRRIEYQFGGVRVEVDAADVGSVSFEDCEPVRDFPTRVPLSRSSKVRGGDDDSLSARDAVLDPRCSAAWLDGG